MAVQSSSITLLQSTTVYVPNLTSYKMSLSVTNAQNITNTVFVKQRLRNSSNQINDVFAAIATPNQLASLGVGAPTADTSYFLDSKVCLIANTVEYLNEVLQEILQELQSLVTDVELLDNLEESSIFTITSGSINVNNYVNYINYRLPMTAMPCGTQTVTSGIVTITGVNSNLHGWLPTTGSDPSGYYFKYNIPEDSSLNLIFPPSTDKLSLAYIEKNGVVIDDGTVLINQNGIYWSNNTFGESPWPSDFEVNPSVPGGGTIETSTTLILNITV